VNQIRNYKLHSRITLAFIFIAIVSTICYLVIMSSVLDGLETATLDAMLGHELEELVVDLAQNPEAELPVTASVKAYLQSRDHLIPVPDFLKNLSANVYKKLQVGEKIYQVAIVDLNDDRMYLTFDITVIARNLAVVLDMLIAGGLLSTIVLLISGFWLFRKFLLPVSDLADEVSRIDPNDRKIHIDSKYQGYEVGLIAQSIDGFLQRFDEFVEREQSFTAAASHELRTPISVVATAIDLLELKGVTGEQQVVINRIKESTDYMNSVIEALLFFARGSNDIFEKTLPELSLPRIIIKILRDYKAEASAKNLKFRVKFKSRLKVRMSESHMEILLGNLIRNAVANTSEGYIKVTLLENGFSVTDTGVGMEPDEVELMVKHAHLSPNNAGFGLGLYLVKNICQAYGLKLEVDSTVGKGTEFRVFFPEKVVVEALASEDDTEQLR
jgi:signal transduction histidine kinase